MTAAPEQPVSFSSGPLTLRGVMSLPVEFEPRRRGVVLIHGWGGCRIGPHRMLTHMARRLHTAGFATLRFDLRGRGDSDGAADQADLDGMIDDTQAAARFLATQPGVERVSLLGICSGANVALGAATLNPEIADLALWSVLPFQRDKRATQDRTRTRHMLRLYLGKALRWETWRRLIRGDVNMAMVGKAIGGESKPTAEGRNLKMSSRDILKAFGDFRGRALFVTGGKDPEGLEGKALFEPFCGKRNLQAQFRLIDGANHSFYEGAHAQAVMERTLAWLTETT